MVQLYPVTFHLLKAAVTSPADSLLPMLEAMAAKSTSVHKVKAIMGIGSPNPTILGSRFAFAIANCFLSQPALI